MKREFIKLLLALGCIFAVSDVTAQQEKLTKIPPSVGRWYNAFQQDCSSFCSSVNGVNVLSPDGFACTSGENRPWSAIRALVDYSPTGCWHNCAEPEGLPGAVSIGHRCYHPTQKRDNDRTDVTVGCFCRPFQCGDKVDNDRDGVIDLADPGCSSARDDNEGDKTTQCQDNVDNDGDGAKDFPADFSCSSRTDNDEANPKSQCQNGLDDDGDGAVDLADFSCQNNKQGNDEASPKAQCQDKTDNDGDGLIDAVDPGCSNPQDNNESDGTSQCQDTKDNDADGLIDMNDPGCSNPQDNNEADGTSQCQDTKDNDADGLIDMNDPGCANPQDNNEADGTSQCQDTKDNDTDGLIDMNDPGCANPQDNNESDGTSQCQDAKDNDADGLIDMNDPGCANPQDNNESDGTSQCQDTKDNDADGLVDMNDPGCANPQDNNESDGTSQCQDTKDNDADGLIDMNDPGCSNPQDNNESDGTSQCQDTKDNDMDGLIDMKDPGCSTAQDNNEGDEPTTLSVGVECLTVNKDGSRTAYFSYNNTTGTDVTVTTNATLGTVNEFTTAGSTTPPPTLFKAGLAKGSVVVTFAGDSLTWLVRAQKSAASRVTASAATPVCAPIAPQAECRGFQNGVITVRLGYVNGNPFEQQVPVGPSNGFKPGEVDRGQPNRFFAGTNKSVFQVPLVSATDSFTWVVNGTSVKVDNTLPVCDGECVDTPTGSVTAELDAVAKQLSDLMTRAANILASAKATSGKKVSATAERNRTDAERAKKKAQEYTAQAKILTIQFPQVVKTCPQAPTYCETVDRQYAIESLKGLYANQRNSIQRTIARAYFRNTGQTTRDDSLVKQAKTLEQQGLTALAKLPRFETQCR